jgi:hypothetical protein
MGGYPAVAAEQWRGAQLLAFADLYNVDVRGHAVEQAAGIDRASKRVTGYGRLRQVIYRLELA